MTVKKIDKPTDEAVKDAVAVVKKVADTLAAVEKTDPPKGAKPKALDEVILDFGKHDSNSRMKRAVKDTQKLGTTVVPVEKVKGPVVVIAGMNISPVATGLKPTGPCGDMYVHEGKEFHLPGHLLFNPHTRTGVDENEPWIRTTSYQGPEMSLFAFVYDGDTFYLLMDEHSSFTRDTQSYYGRSKGGMLIMINSVSNNDQFIGHNVLVNVESEDGTYNQSSIIVSSSRVGPIRGWGESSAFKVGSKREKYSNIRLKKVDVVDTALSRGRYYSCNFTKCHIRGTGTTENDITNSYLTECRIKGSRVTLVNLSGESLDFSAEGEILIKNVGKLKDQQWSFPSIHVTNRFAFTEIDYLTRHDRAIKMVRISPTEVELSLTLWKDNVKVAIDTPRYTVESIVREGLREDKDKKTEPAQFLSPFVSPTYNGPFQPLGYRGLDRPTDGIRGYMEGYIVDQVVSRLGVIQMLDEVEKAAQDITYGRTQDYINFLE